MRSPPVLVTAVAAGLCATHLVAQPASGSLEAKDLFPPDHTAELAIDFHRLLDTRIWNELERSPWAKMNCTLFRKRMGFRFDDLLELRMVERVRELPNQQDPRFETDRALLYRSMRNLSLPKPAPDNHPPRRLVKVGARTVIQEGQDRLWAEVGPKSLIQGSKGWISSVLEGKARGQLPSGLVGFPVGSRPLAYIAFKLRYDKDYLKLREENNSCS